VAVDTQDPGVDQGVHRQSLEGIAEPAMHFGLFLKATSSLVGPADGVVLHSGERRSDYETELAVIIGTTAKDVRAVDAMSCVAGYCVGMDITVRGTEDRSFRKSPDSYTVLGPWLTTADEIDDPHDLPLWLTLNGESRQASSTSQMTVDIPRLIELASSMYTLHPGDVLLTGTPEGVGALAPGDVFTAGIDGIGAMTVQVRGS
jgi:2-keto-4-pentenoate hydratase/2-oxohepta-3-ene-1,7-dioic acid hydratase in catechol pathway